MSLLEVEELSVAFASRSGQVPILHDISFSIERGQSLGIVGESGCGKSLTALSVMGLLPDNAITSGKVTLEGQNLLQLDDRTMSAIRGTRMAMIFQEPMTALNPVKTIGYQIAEGLRWHFGMSAREARKRTAELLDHVGLPVARFSPRRFPHELSGGQRQRVVIAMALACEPDILIADEPTTALDVTTQSQILDLLVEITSEQNMGLVMITHDLGVIAEMTDKMLIMYSGRIIEEGPTETVFGSMAHPYTSGLFGAMPAADAVSQGPFGRARLAAIPGEVPSPSEAMQFGCAFAPRCQLDDARCRASLPPAVSVAKSHNVACFKPQNKPAIPPSRRAEGGT